MEVRPELLNCRDCDLLVRSCQSKYIDYVSIEIVPKVTVFGILALVEAAAATRMGTPRFALQQANRKNMNILSSSHERRSETDADQTQALARAREERINRLILKKCSKRVPTEALTCHIPAPYRQQTGRRQHNRNPATVAAALANAIAEKGGDS